VFEPSWCILRRNELETISDGFFQSLAGACSHPPQVCLELAPRLLDGREVRRVSRQKQQAVKTASGKNSKVQPQFSSNWRVV
jgi:hypothetical protein